MNQKGLKIALGILVIFLAIGYFMSTGGGYTAIGGGYSKKGNVVYWYNGEAGRYIEIPGADPESFTSLPGTRYAKDKNSAYYLTHIVGPGVNVATFEALNNFYAKDKDTIYSQQNVIPNADVNTFDVFTKMSYDNYDKEFYARDRNTVYYGGIVIEGADPVSFSILKRPYSKDKSFLFYGSHKIENSDPSTFEYMNEFYSKDRNNVYYTGHYQVDWCVSGKTEPKRGPQVCVIKEADATTFKIFGSEQQCGLNCTFDARDKNHKYREGLMIN